jgi:lipoprotein-releasing system permease protein
VLGIGFCLLQQHFGLIRIPVETLLIDSYPVQLRAGDLLAVAAAFCAVIGVVSQLTVRSVIKRSFSFL